MTGIIVAGHGHFAGGILSAVELTVGIPTHLACVDFCKGQDIVELKQNMQKAIDAMDAENILLMVDILGGSPFNVAAQLLMEGAKKNLKIITGINMAAVIHAVFSREAVPFEELCTQVLEAGKEGLVSSSALMPE